ncbi:MAG: thiamine phosphate synthase [Gemmataceae bacterium]|nr:thiamine phosphate synthase [Gemmataceae bacterium]MDW8242830.1 thiamine phosphate synthase [Thermogemmata sp.]
MEFLTSPGVERALTAASQWAARLGSEVVQLTHFILALLDEEEGRVIDLLGRLGVQPTEVRQQLLTTTLTTPAPPVEVLLAAARDWAIAHRQDPQLLTDDLLLAILHADPQLAAFMAPLGLDIHRLQALRGNHRDLDNPPPSSLESVFTSQTESPIFDPSAASGKAFSRDAMSPALHEQGHFRPVPPMAATPGQTTTTTSQVSARSSTNDVDPPSSAAPQDSPSLLPISAGRTPASFTTHQDSQRSPTSPQTTLCPNPGKGDNDTAAMGSSQPGLPLSHPGKAAIKLEDCSATSAISSWLRILDVNCNRCREALRVLDDYCRFVRNDPVLTAAVKELRHAFAAWEQRLPLTLRLTARNTPGDVGTRLMGSGEYLRRSVSEVALANLKRLQEALRSLEEYGKLHDPAWAAQAEQLRYQVYNLEAQLLRPATRTVRLAQARLYWLFSTHTIGDRWRWQLERAIAGGVQIVQLREKNLPDRQWFQVAQQVADCCRQAGVLFIVNDRADLACGVEADGVHLGQEDLPIELARRLLGPDTLVGCSTHAPHQVEEAIRAGADYLGVGPVFPSPTKPFDHFPGLEFVRQATTLTRHVPAFALGGITLDNLSQVLAAGARRIAVSSLLSHAEDPAPIARQLRTALDAVPLP